jgi:hypothetical protein
MENIAYDLSIVEHIVDKIRQCNFDNVLPANRLVQLQDNIRLFDYVSLLHRFSYGLIYMVICVILYLMKWMGQARDALACLGVLLASHPASV